MKKLFSICCFFLSFGSFYKSYGQDYIPPARQNASIDLIYGQKFYKNDFYKTLSNQNNISFGGNPSCVGLLFAGAIPYEKQKPKFRNFAGTCIKILPFEFVLNDTIKGKVSGFNLGFTLIGYDCFPKSRALDLILIVGANTGRLKLYDNNLIRSHNPYFSPKITVFPRISIKRFTISLLAEYEQDISKAGWKKMRFGKAGSVNVDGFDQTGYSFYFGIGYRISEGTDKKD